MKAKVLLYAAVVVAISLSCTREAEESGLLNSGIEMEFTAEWADGNDVDSRTAIQEDESSIWWTPNEEINVFFGTGSSGRFVSTNTEPKPVVSFYGTLNTIIGGMETEGDKPVYWAVYPYSSTNTCDGQSVTLTVPLDQSGTKGTFADKFFPAVACGDSYSLAFYNICGGARFSVTQEGVTKVIFKSNDGSPMAGKVKVGFGDDNKPQILEITESVDSVIVSAPEGGFVPGTNYFAAMLPQTHAKGITVALLASVRKATKIFSNSITIHRSSFGLLDNLDKGLDYVSRYAVPEMVDMGLSVKWASFNLGATKPEEYGDYFAWGETEPKDNCSWETYRWCDGAENTMTKYCGDPSYGYNSFTDGKTILDSENDAATVALGGKWRVATKDEWEELTKNCEVKSINYNGIDCRKLTSKIAGYTDKWIVIPLAGRQDGSYVSHMMGYYNDYWASTVNENFNCAYSYCAYGQYMYSVFRYYGLPIRPVYDKIDVTSIALDFTYLILRVDESAQLNIAISPSNASNKEVQWYSSDETVAIVSSEGLITGIGIGKTTITVTSIDGGFTAKCVVEVMSGDKTPEMVDLGLSVKWASCNLGASSPEDYGEHYQWGTDRNQFSKHYYKWAKSYDEYGMGLTKYCDWSSSGYYGFVDYKTLLDTEDDVASNTLGDKWHIPTKGDWAELRQNCHLEHCSYNGVTGIKVTSKKSGYSDKWIFLPAAGYGNSLNPYIHDQNTYGYYWSSSLYWDNPFYASIFFLSPDTYYMSYYERYFGASVRPVYGDYIPVTNVALSRTNMSICLNSRCQITSTITPGNASEVGVKLSSSDDSVITIDDRGLVTAVGLGIAEIIAQTTDAGLKATCAVKVVTDIMVPNIVDLGLSVMWGTFNIGASAPEDYGLYFAWGETEPKEDYSWSTYKWCMGSDKTLTKYCNESSYGYNGFTDNKTLLDSDDDVATVSLRGKWRMPTSEEIDELINNSIRSKTIVNGTKGYRFTSKIPGYTNKWIFLPAAGYMSDTRLIGTSGIGGYYWSSSLKNAGRARQATPLRFDYSSGGDGVIEYHNRCDGYSIRPVYDSSTTPEYGNPYNGGGEDW